MAPPRSRLFLIILVVVTALGALAMQMFIPSLPVIAADFAVSAGVSQLALSLSMVSIAVTMLIYGPLSDRFGRRRVLLTGLALFLIGSVICGLAPDIETLIVGRIVQAAGGAAGMVLSRAIVRDVYGRERSAQAIAYITMAMVVAPMVAPAIGGIITDAYGWRWIFVFVGVCGLLVTALTALRLAETLAEPQPIASPVAMIRGFGRLLRIPAFCGYTFQAAFSMASFFAFMSGTPYIMVDIMGRPPSEFGLYFILVAGAYMVGNFMAGRMSVRVGLDRMIVLGSILSLVSIFCTVILIAMGHWQPWAIFGPAVFVAIGNGMSMPNSQAGAVSVDPKVAGTASGLSMFMQMMTAAITAQAVGSMTNGTPYPTVGFMLFCAVAALIAIAIPLLNGRRQAAGARTPVS